jgi:hypothetical protein
LPATRREEDDHVVDSLWLALILRTETILAARRSPWRACLVKGELRSTAPWRGGRGCAREQPETSREREWRRKGLGLGYRAGFIEKGALGRPSDEALGNGR